MKITKKTANNEVIYYYNGVIKYSHYKDIDGYEQWSEYDKQGKEIHSKDSNGYERWSENNPNNPKNKMEMEEVLEEDVKPFEFQKTNLTLIK